MTITFADAIPPDAAIPERMDAALFVGFALPRPGPVPDALAAWLGQRGWAGRLAERGLCDVPVPIRSFDEFDRRFAWRRPTVAGGESDTPLGAALRAHFAHGGSPVTVIPMGPPPDAGAGEPTRIRALARLLWGDSTRWDLATGRDQVVDDWLAPLAGSTDDPATWHGVGHVLGIEDAALVVVPDLPELIAVTPRTLPPPIPPAVDEVFTTCAATPVDLRNATVAVEAPRADEVGYRLWRRIANHLVRFIADQAREAQLVLALPLPADGERTARREPGRWLDTLLDAAPADGGVASAFLQLGWPWLGGAVAADLPGGLLPPDGVISGILSANAGRRGTFRSAAAAAVAAVGLEPALPQSQEEPLARRLCLIGRTPDGLRLLADRTTSGVRAWQAGPVSRLIGLVARQARLYAQDLVFAPSGEAAWRSLEDGVGGILEIVRERGGLRGARGEAYAVTCDRSTMSQADLDAGRLIARIALQPAYPVDAIQVTLDAGNGQVVMGGRS